MKTREFPRRKRGRLGAHTTRMARPQVRCDVTTCAYNLPGNLCAAERIEMREQHRDRPATGDGDTACHAFLYRRGLVQTLTALGGLNLSGLVAEPFHRGTTETTPEVDCGVRNCLHWTEGGTCRAESIQVSGEAATLPEETNCSTFVPREF